MHSELHHRSLVCAEILGDAARGGVTGLARLAKTHPRGSAAGLRTGWSTSRNAGMRARRATGLAGRSLRVGTCQHRRRSGAPASRRWAPRWRARGDRAPVQAREQGDLGGRRHPRRVAYRGVEACCGPRGAPRLPRGRRRCLARWRRRTAPEAVGRRARRLARRFRAPRMAGLSSGAGHLQGHALEPGGASAKYPRVRAGRPGFLEPDDRRVWLQARDPMPHGSARETAPLRPTPRCARVIASARRPPGDLAGTRN